MNPDQIFKYARKKKERKRTKERKILHVFCSNPNQNRKESKKESKNERKKERKKERKEVREKERKK